VVLRTLSLSTATVVNTALAVSITFTVETKA